MTSEGDKVVLTKDDVKEAITYWLAGVHGLLALEYNVNVWKQQVAVRVKEI